MDGGMERTDGKITRGSEINQSVIDGVLWDGVMNSKTVH